MSSSNINQQPAAALTNNTARRRRRPPSTPASRQQQPTHQTTANQPTTNKQANNQPAVPTNRRTTAAMLVSCIVALYCQYLCRTRPTCAQTDAVQLCRRQTRQQPTVGQTVSWSNRQPNRQLVDACQHRRRRLDNRRQPLTSQTLPTTATTTTTTAANNNNANQQQYYFYLPILCYLLFAIYLYSDAPDDADSRCRRALNSASLPPASNKQTVRLPVVTSCAAAVVRQQTRPAACIVLHQARTSDLSDITVRPYRRHRHRRRRRRHRRSLSDADVTDDIDDNNNNRPTHRNNIPTDNIDPDRHRRQTIVIRYHRTVPSPSSSLSTAPTSNQQPAA